MTVPPSDERPDTPSIPSTPSIRSERIATAIAYIGFAIFSLFFAPGEGFQSPELAPLLSGDISNVNDIVFAILNLFGVVVLCHSVLLNPGGGRQTRLPFVPFTLGAFFLGIGFLGPYIIARDYVPSISAEEVADRSWYSRWLEGKPNAIFTVLYAVWAYAFALGLFTPGSEQLHDLIFYSAAVDLWRLMQSDKIICNTTIDFLLMSIAMWSPLKEDMRRRGWFVPGRETESAFTALSILSTPGLGPAIYILLRPGLPSAEEMEKGKKA